MRPTDTTASDVAARHELLMILFGVRHRPAGSTRPGARGSHEVGEMIDDGRTEQRCMGQAHCWHGDGRAAVDRGDQQSRQFPAVMFLALVGESGDQSKVVKDITAHAATVAR